MEVLLKKKDFEGRGRKIYLLITNKEKLGTRRVKTLTRSLYLLFSLENFD